MAAYKKADIILYISFVGGPILTLHNARRLQLHTQRPPKLPHLLALSNATTVGLPPSVTLALGRRDDDDGGLCNGDRVGDKVGYMKFDIGESKGQLQIKVYAQLVCLAYLD